MLTSLVRSIEHYFLLGLRRDISRYPISYGSIRSGTPEGILAVVNLLILAQVECEQSDLFLDALLGLSEPTKAYIARVVEAFKTDERVQYLEYAEAACSSAILNHSGSTGIEYDRENRQHFADKDRMIEDQNRLITTLQTKLEDSQQQLADKVAELERMSSQHKDVINTYVANISYLEGQVRSLSKHGDNESELILLRNQLAKLQSVNSQLESRIKEPANSVNYMPQELDEFVESGGTLTGRVRDAVIRTLKEQLALRDEEIAFHRDERGRALEQFRKNEKLLVSAVHSIAMRYHEEMISHDGAGINQESNRGTITPERNELSPPFGG